MMQTVAKKRSENSSAELDKPQKKGTLGGLVQREINPLWHNLASRTTQGWGAYAHSLSSVNAKMAGTNKTTLLQRLCTECEEDESELQFDQIQSKLTIGAADDFYERKADAVAETVMRTPLWVQNIKQTPLISKSASVPLAQRQCADSDQPHLSAEVDQVQRKPGLGSQNHPANGQVKALISSPGVGIPLSDSVRNRIEPVLGVDLSSVRTFGVRSFRSTFIRNNYLYLQPKASKHSNP